MMIVAAVGAGVLVGEGVGDGVPVALGEGVGVGVGSAYDVVSVPEPAVAAISPVTTAMRRQAPADTIGSLTRSAAPHRRSAELRHYANCHVLRITDEP